MKSQKGSLWEVGMVLVLLLFVVMGCSDTGGGDSNPTGTGNLPADPGSGNLAGIVVGTIGGQPLVGVTVSAKGQTTTTDSEGTFKLDGVGEGSFGVTISGNAVYLRTAAVNTANGRSVRLDAIEVNSAFNLGFYREIARGHHPNEGDLFQTHRWTNSTRPTFIIDTDASATLDGVISQDQINTVSEVLSKIVPVFTGGFYASPTVKLQPFRQISLDLIPDNSFVITFDDSLISIDAYGLTNTTPDFTASTTSTINKTLIYLIDFSQMYQGITFREVIAHESGHGFGFRHTSDILPSVMVAIGAFGGLYGDADKLHMSIMYHRPAGNTDIDNDLVPGAKMMGQPLGVQVFIDRRANFPKSPELLERVRNLPSKIPRALLEQAARY